MQLTGVVKSADIDGDGLINKEEFKQLLAQAGAKGVSESDIAKLFAKADADGDGELTAAELKALTELGRGKLHAVGNI